ncbi:MAG: hypothetical protein KC964_19785 [Candidatus Omnitrophica bacterium]|nr:hypothetical protein [Candidatus Omnitrophota bacterium]
MSGYNQYRWACELLYRKLPKCEQVKCQGKNRIEKGLAYLNHAFTANDPEFDDLCSMYRDTYAMELSFYTNGSPTIFIDDPNLISMLGNMSVSEGDVLHYIPSIEETTPDALEVLWEYSKCVTFSKMLTLDGKPIPPCIMIPTNGNIGCALSIVVYCHGHNSWLILDISNLDLLNSRIENSQILFGRSVEQAKNLQRLFYTLFMFYSLNPECLVSGLPNHHAFMAGIQNKNSKIMGIKKFRKVNSGGGKSPHLVSGHIRRFKSGFFKKKKGSTIWIAPYWKGTKIDAYTLDKSRKAA